MSTLLVFSNKKDLVPNTLMLTHVEHFEEGQYDSETDIPLWFEQYVTDQSEDIPEQVLFLYDQQDVNEYLSLQELVVNEDCLDRLDHDEMIGSYQHPKGNIVTYFGVLI